VFDDADRLAAFVDGLDAVIHLAGVNRAPDEDLYSGNVGLADGLVAACEAVGVRPHVVFASSTHVERETPTAYGRGKLDAAARLEAWAARSGGAVTTFVIPHVFGEYGRPQYNSAVATFCHQLANGERPVVHQDAPLELIHAQDLAEALVNAAASEGPGAGTQRLSGRPTTVVEVLGVLREMDQTYRGGVIPSVDDPFRLRLFNQYRSYLYPAYYPVAMPLHADARGHLFETVKAGSGGQCFVSTTHPGITRGNHFHRFKVERFFVLSGTARIDIRPVLGDEVRSFVVNGAQPCYVDIPTLQTHNITNVGRGELVTLFWSHEVFDPASPDTYFEGV
jgi:UDP-2-acetamido-2,6-beta-L-arabino-hexul-4-ose reductase